MISRSSGTLSLVSVNHRASTPNAVPRNSVHSDPPLPVPNTSPTAISTASATPAENRRRRENLADGDGDRVHRYVAEPPDEQPVPDDRAHHVGHRGGHRQCLDDVARRERSRGDQHQQHLDAHHPDVDQGRDTGVLHCVEHAQLQHHDGERQQPEGRHRQHDAHMPGVLDRGGSVRKDHRAQRRTENHQTQRDRHQRDRREPDAQREVAHHRVDVVVRRRPAHPGHQGGEQRDAENAVGHLEQQISADECGKTGVADRDPADHQQADLADHDVAEHPADQFCVLRRVRVRPAWCARRPERQGDRRA